MNISRKAFASLAAFIFFLLLLLASSSLQAAGTDASGQSDESGQEQDPGSLVVDRIKREQALSQNRSALLAHQRNYLLPLTWAPRPRQTRISASSIDENQLDEIEAQFQISLKTPLAEDLFFEDDALFVGFTVRSFWQAYNNAISAPFRESNYEPELFWVKPVPWKILGGDASLLVLGLSHQSNGRVLPLSRSWNRVYANLIWERNRFVFSFKPWWRIPEHTKTDPQQPDGDDNPDIDDYMGNFELGIAYRKFEHEYSLMLRNNLDSKQNRGAIQIDWTFPLDGKLRAYVQLFNGYGESLIDYNHSVERIGIGFLLSDLL